MDVKKVWFVAEPTIDIIECDSPRDGSIWMQFARDRAQFQRRIESQTYPEACFATSC